MVIRKRDGREVEFDENRIRNAIEKAFIEVDGIVEVKKNTKEIIDKVCEHISKLNKDLTVEEIQDIVEHKLMTSNRKDVAKAYILYRDKREVVRALKNRDDSILGIINGTNEYVKTENSNKNPTLIPTQRDYIAGEVCKDIARKYYIPKDIMEAHDKGLIHLSDMDYSPVMPMYNCCLINLEDMLQNGTVISGVKIDKPNSFSTACTIATQIITQVASSQYGLK